MIFPTPKLFDVFDPTITLEGIFSVYGDFGVGKTTFALQTAINSAKQGKNVIYIYSKPIFPVEKLRNILGMDITSDMEEHPFDFIDNVTFIQTTDFKDLNTIIFNLEFLILDNIDEKDGLINLIVIDSITDLYRLEIDRDKKEKNFELNHGLNQILANLVFINDTYQVEVLIINSITIKRNEEESELIQYGGNVMDYWVLNSVLISRTGIMNERELILTKNPEKKKLEFHSILTEKGFS